MRGANYSEGILGMERFFPVAHAWDNEPALAPPSGCRCFAPPPEVSAVAATSGYCLPTLRVEEGRDDWQIHREMSAKAETICQPFGLKRQRLLAIHGKWAGNVIDWEPVPG